MATNADHDLVPEEKTSSVNIAEKEIMLFSQELQGCMESMLPDVARFSGLLDQLNLLHEQKTLVKL